MIRLVLIAVLSFVTLSHYAKCEQQPFAKGIYDSVNIFQDKVEEAGVDLVDSVKQQVESL